jgi:hypothetical protein
MIDLIRSEFSVNPDEGTALERELSRSGQRKYQAAFSFLQGRRGQQTANEIVCKAVLAALRPDTAVPAIDFSDQAAAEGVCRTLQADVPRWHLNPGTAALGKLAAEFPNQFGETLLTTNFDPLLEIAIQRAGGRFYKTVLHSDGNLGQTEASGCHVVHFHGFWLGTDTLHTARQLGQPRPHLKDSLRSLLRNKLVVACGYGGWVAELLVARQQITLAYVFYRAAFLKWQQASPPRAAQIRELAQQFKDRIHNSAEIGDSSVEGIWIDWTLGEDVDKKFA